MRQVLIIVLLFVIIAEAVFGITFLSEYYRLKAASVEAARKGGFLIYCGPPVIVIAMANALTSLLPMPFVILIAKMSPSLIEKRANVDSPPKMT